MTLLANPKPLSDPPTTDPRGWQGIPVCMDERLGWGQQQREGTLCVGREWWCSGMQSAYWPSLLQHGCSFCCSCSNLQCISVERIFSQVKLLILETAGESALEETIETGLMLERVIDIDYAT